MAAAFIHGFLLALALILPLGPQNSFVLSQATTMARFRLAVPVVVTAALSDTVLIAASIAGINVVLVAVPAFKWAMTGLGVLFLVWMGLKSWQQSGEPTDLAAGGGSRWRLGRRVRYSLTVSLLNPHAIIDTVVVIGGGAASYSVEANKLSYAFAAVLVSWVWFFFLGLVGSSAQRLRDPAAVRRNVNRISAIIMWVVAARYMIEIGHAIVG